MLNKQIVMIAIIWNIKVMSNDHFGPFIISMLEIGVDLPS